MLYRILTEHKRRDKIIGIVAGQFNSFTLIDGLGYWKGKPEKALIIEIAAGISERETIAELCRTINRVNAQECTLLQEVECRSTLI